MATTFADLYPLIRAASGDSDPLVVQFSDDVLKNHVRLTILSEEDSGIAEDGTTETFTSDLTVLQKGIAVYRTARSLVVHSNREFSYKNPVVAVKRVKEVGVMLAHIDMCLAAIDSDNIAYVEGELDAMLQGAERYQVDYDAALANTPASS